MFDKDDLELNPESEEDLDVGEDEGEGVAGGTEIGGVTGTTKPTTGLSGTGGISGPVRPAPLPGINIDPKANTGGACTCNSDAQGCTACQSSTCT